MVRNTKLANPRGSAQKDGANWGEGVGVHPLDSLFLNLQMFAILKIKPESLHSLHSAQA